MGQTPAPPPKPRRRGEPITAAKWNQEVVSNPEANLATLFCQSLTAAPYGGTDSVRIELINNVDDLTECLHCAMMTQLQEWDWKALHRVMMSLGYTGFCEFCGAPYEPEPEQGTRQHDCEDHLIETTSYSDTERQYLCRICGRHISEGEHCKFHGGTANGYSTTASAAFARVNKAAREMQVAIGREMLISTEKAVQALTAFGKAMHG